MDAEFTIYTKSGCPYCVRAKDLLRSTRRSAQVKEIDCDPFLTSAVQKEEFLATMATYCGRSYRTFPMIFHQGQFVGGYSELLQYLERQHQMDDAFAEWDEAREESESELKQEQQELQELQEQPQQEPECSLNA